MRNVIIQLSLLTWSLTFWSCGDNDDPIIPDESSLEMVLNKAAVTMAVSDKDTLSVTTDIGVLTVDWLSSDPSVVSVNNQGIIEAMSLGSAEITATVDDLVAKCIVEVKIKTLDLNKSSVTLKVTDRDTLSVVSDIFDKTVEWASSDPSVVSVDEEGRLKALKSGDAEVSATVDDLTTICNVTVDLTIFLGGSSKEFEAAYWKDGKIHKLTTDGNDIGLYSYVNSIKVAHGDIYAGGQRQERFTTVWKNGEEINIEVGGANEIRELAVINDQIVGVGGNNRVFLWDETDGFYFWTESGNQSRGTSIYVENSNIYVGGMINTGSVNRATVWKNKQAFALDYTTNHTVIDVFVSNGDFYTCAYENMGSGKYKSKYWKNEKLIELTDGNSHSLPLAIHVIGDDVYVGGVLNYRPVIWKNGETVFYEAEGVYGTIDELASIGTDLYAVGNIEVGGNAFAGLVWKNGEEIFRTELFDNAYLKCIDIK